MVAAARPGRAPDRLRRSPARSSRETSAQLGTRLISAPAWKAGARLPLTSLPAALTGRAACADPRGPEVY